MPTPKSASAAVSLPACSANPFSAIRHLPQRNLRHLPLHPLLAPPLPRLLLPHPPLHLA